MLPLPSRADATSQLADPTLMIKLYTTLSSTPTPSSSPPQAQCQIIREEIIVENKVHDCHHCDQARQANPELELNWD